MRKILLILLLLGQTRLFAQDLFVTKGKIEFEKTVNVHKNMDAMSTERNSFWEEVKKKMPVHDVTYFDLYFDSTISLYKPGKETPDQLKGWDYLKGPATKNVVYKNFATDQSISLKSVYESSYLIQDSLRKIDWKIKNETRTIAGFECRRAETIIMDSIYVIAFYTDRIISSSGPESFNGLPGMILGLVVPRLYTTWFATKIQITGISPGDFTPPSKGKKISKKELMADLQTAMKDWGNSGDRNIWRIML